MTIVVPVSNGASGAALDAAIELCRAQGDSLHAVFHNSDPEVDQSEIDRVEDELYERLESEPFAFVVDVQFGGGIAATITRIAEETDARMVVVSLARRPANGRLTLGNQIQQLLVDSPCPVLVVREESLV